MILNYNDNKDFVQISFHIMNRTIDKPYYHNCPIEFWLALKVKILSTIVCKMIGVESLKLRKIKNKTLNSFDIKSFFLINFLIFYHLKYLIKTMKSKNISCKESFLSKLIIQNNRIVIQI